MAVQDPQYPARRFWEKDTGQQHIRLTHTDRDAVAEVLREAYSKGQLDDEEFEIMKLHPAIGEEILRHLPSMAKVVTIVRHHHERYDGRGYPDGITAGDEMPLEDFLAYCIGVADAYQAMTSDRTYRRSPGHAFAIGQLNRNKGTQFMPEAVEALERYVGHESAPLAEVQSA